MPPGAIHPEWMCSQEQGPSRRREKDQCKLRRTRPSGNRRETDEWWGHRLQKKEQNVVRICALNINGLGLSRNSVKNHDIRQHMELEEVDIMGISEVNIHWDKVEQRDSIWERTEGWFENVSVSPSYNVHDPNASRDQPGGTLMLAKDGIVHTIRGIGADDSGLGRWSWMKITGKHKYTTRVVTVYSPASSGRGVSSVYTQHLTHLGGDPVEAFYRDLGSAIHQWQEEGDQLIVMGDWNEDVQSTNIKRWMNVFGLEEAITYQHDGRAPATYQRGKRPIDGIFVSPNLIPDRSGYLPFGMLPGDHRGIWMDIEKKYVYGYTVADTPIAAARRLKLNDPRVVKRYIDTLHELFKHHNLYGRVRNLRQSIEDSLTEKQAEEYEEIDGIRERCMKRAEQKCRKLKMGGRKWSPELQNARDKIKMWTLVRRRCKNCKVSTRTIIRLNKKLEVNTKNATLQQAQEALNKAYLEYKALRIQHEDLNKTYRERLAKAKAAEGNTKAATELRNIQHREMQRKTARRIKRALRKNVRAGTTKVQVMENGTMQELTSKSDMEKAILQENEDKFHQTEGWCPLLHGQLALDLGLIGDGPKIMEVFEGTYECPHGTSQYTRKWLEHMKIEDPQKLQSIRTTLSDYRQGWKNINERTASGELHMGHFKAGCTHPEVGWLHFYMSGIPMYTGYSPRRWRQGMDVMLLKVSDVYLLKKLRTIVLYEADYNHENKRIGRDSMRMALERKQIADEQYSCPGRSSQDNALNKRLVFDHFRFNKKNLGICACDLKSCYDRIAHTAASIALQRVGVPLKKIKCMFATIQRLVHHVRTVYGKSDKSFGGEEHTYLVPPQGTGQGNGAAPSIWSILSSTIFQLLHKEGYGTAFCSALSRGLFHLCGFSYVDDCDLITTAESIEQVVVRLQRIMDLWDNYMQVTGAAIAPDKCWWYLAAIQWKKGQWSYKKGLQYELTTRDKEGRRQRLKYLEVSEAQEMVGVFLAPDGSQNTQAEELRKKARLWAAYIKSAHLGHEATWKALQTTILKSIEYPLVASTLSKQECISIMTPVLDAALPRSNIAARFARDVLYGPIRYQGMGLHNPYITQGIRHVKDIVEQTWKGTTSGKLIKCSIESAQLESGLYEPIFWKPRKISWWTTTNTWIIDTHDFCRDNGISIKIGETIRPQCTRDWSIMESFEQQGYTKSEIRTLNLCRLYLQVTSLSEVTNGRGTQILQERKPRKSNPYTWPMQGNPTPSMWKEWDLALQKCFGNNTAVLNQPLGKWECSQDEFYEWEWFVGTDGSLYQQIENQWIPYNAVQNSRTRGKRFVQEIDSPIFSQRPCEMYRTVVRRSGPYYTHTGVRDWDPRTEDIEKLGDPLFQGEWYSKHLRVTRHIQSFIRTLYRGKVTGVSDGTYEFKTSLCAAAWILSTPAQLEIEGAGLVPGTHHDSSAYRGELGGLLALLSVIEQIEKAYPPPGMYSIRICCDGESALFKALTTPKYKLTVSNKSFDILCQISEIKGRLRAEVEPYHVKGHADDLYRTLTWEEELNCRMDKSAKMVLQHLCLDPTEMKKGLPTEEDGPAIVKVGSLPINSELGKNIRFQIGKNNILRWWVKKERLKESEIEMIDWSVVGAVMTEASFKMKKFMAKWVTGQFGVGIVMEYRRARKSNCCPRCYENVEDPIHVIQCPDRRASEEWDRLIKELQEWMRKTDTEPNIRAGLSQVLWAYRETEGNRMIVPNGLPVRINECFRQQATIGCTQLLNGLLTTEWARVQDQYYKSRGSRRHGRRWAINLSKQLWKLVFGMWDHRNTILFSGEDVIMNGEELLRYAIQQELAYGIGRLSPIYAHYLQTTTKQLFKKSIQHQKQWLSVIRKGRIAAGATYHDELSESLEAQVWIGLITQEEANSHRRNDLSEDGTDTSSVG